jgi:hypothetical protein
MKEKKLELRIFQSSGGLDPTYKLVDHQSFFNSPEEARVWINEQVQIGALSGDNTFLVQETHDVVVFRKKTSYTMQGELSPEEMKEKVETFLDEGFEGQMPRAVAMYAAPMPARRRQGARGRGGAVTKYGGPF